MAFDEFTVRMYMHYLWRLLRQISPGMLCLFPVNASRTGAALDIFLEYSDLACLSNWYPMDGDTNPLTTMFETLMKGRRGCLFL
jgi:hypothetical protein